MVIDSTLSPIVDCNEALLFIGRVNFHFQPDNVREILHLLHAVPLFVTIAL